MENNEENLGSQEPVSQPSSNAPKSFNVKPVAIIVAVVAILLVLFFMLFTRSPKDTVKAYVKAFDKADAGKVMSLMDYEGASAFSACTSYSGKTDFSKFQDNYDKIMDQVKDFDKDQKSEYKKLKKDAEESLQDSLDTFKDKKIKYSVKDIKTEKVDENKKLTKVTAKLTVKYDGEEQTKEVTFYTMKKGLKNYIVSSSL